MILKFDLKELQTRIGCNLIEDNFIERVLIENYTYKRRDGVDYTSLLKDIFLSEGFDMVQNDIDINSLIPENKIISITYKVLDMMEVLILSSIKDLNFKNILFKYKENNICYFEVIY